MKIEHKRLKSRYQMELTVEVTGKSEEAIKKIMDRNNMSFAEVIKYYLEK